MPLIYEKECVTGLEILNFVHSFYKEFTSCQWCVFQLKLSTLSEIVWILKPQFWKEKFRIEDCIHIIYLQYYIVRMQYINRQWKTSQINNLDWTETTILRFIRLEPANNKRSDSEWPRMFVDTLNDHLNFLRDGQYIQSGKSDDQYEKFIVWESFEHPRVCYDKAGKKRTGVEKCIWSCWWRRQVEGEGGRDEKPVEKGSACWGEGEEPGRQMWREGVLW